MGGHRIDGWWSLELIGRYIHVGQSDYVFLDLIEMLACGSIIQSTADLQLKSKNIDGGIEGIYAPFTIEEYFFNEEEREHFKSTLER